MPKKPRKVLEPGYAERVFARKHACGSLWPHIILWLSGFVPTAIQVPPAYANS